MKREDCLAAGRLVQLISGRWTLPVIAELSREGRRYHQILDALEGISHKVLTETLRRSERDGLVSRDLSHASVETATLYQLTELGRSLEAPLSSLSNWVAQCWTDVEAANRFWDDRSRNG